MALFSALMAANPRLKVVLNASRILAPQYGLLSYSNERSRTSFEYSPGADNNGATSTNDLSSSVIAVNLQPVLKRWPNANVSHVLSTMPLPGIANNLHETSKTGHVHEFAASTLV